MNVRRWFAESWIVTSWILVLGLTVLPVQHANSEESNFEGVSEPASSEPMADILLVVGAPGTEEYASEFSQWAEQWKEVSRLSGANLVRIGDGDDEANGPLESDDTNDRDALIRHLAGFAGDADGVSLQSRALWIVMLGHGTFAQEVAKFNLRGPDVSASEMAQWIEPIRRPIVIVNAASSSGPFINRLSAPSRVIVTATKSGTEQNYARFGKYFAAAIADPASDLDHDDEVSVQEAFLRASKQVDQFYADAGRIATEHAIVDDNGDGKGTPAKMFRGTRAIGKSKDGSPLDGSSASRMTLVPTGDRLVLNEQQLATRRSIEAELDELRRQKDAIETDQYYRQLEPIMLRLSQLYQQAESASASKDDDGEDDGDSDQDGDRAEASDIDVIDP